jgi:hypothetical protein
MSVQDRFFQALRERNLSEVWNFISDDPQLVHTPEAEGGLFPLHLAARLDDVALARVLLDYGADLESVHAHTFSTPLKYAVFFGGTEMVRFLVQRGADLENRAGGSTTPLDLAYKAPTEQFRRMGTTGSDQDYVKIQNILREGGAKTIKS